MISPIPRDLVPSIAPAGGAAIKAGRRRREGPARPRQARPQAWNPFRAASQVWRRPAPGVDVLPDHHCQFSDRDGRIRRRGRAEHRPCLASPPFAAATDAGRCLDSSITDQRPARSCWSACPIVPQFGQPTREQLSPAACGGIARIRQTAPTRARAPPIVTACSAGSDHRPCALLVAVGLSTRAAMAGVEAATRARHPAHRVSALPLAMIAGAAGGACLHPAARSTPCCARSSAGVQAIWARGSDWPADRSESRRPRHRLRRDGRRASQAHEGRDERALAAGPGPTTGSANSPRAQPQRAGIWDPPDRPARIRQPGLCREIWSRRSRRSRARGRAATIPGDDPSRRPRARSPQALPGMLADQRVDLTYRLIRPDGELRWVRDNGFPIRDHSGEIIRAGRYLPRHHRLEAIERSGSAICTSGR